MSTPAGFTSRWIQKPFGNAGLLFFVGDVLKKPRVQQLFRVPGHQRWLFKVTGYDGVRYIVAREHKEALLEYDRLSREYAPA